ncbi:hypothetical protein CRUP_032712, partial [Coryphaenoides rupestris]
SANSTSVFVVPKKIPTAQEGLDFLLECRVTDPSVGRLALRREGLPLGQRVTLDPRRGALIRDVQLADRGPYVCSALKHGIELTSSTLLLLVKPRLLGPPVVFINQEVFIRAVGESLDITCQSSNPNPRYTLTWTHTHLQGLNRTPQHFYKDQRYYQNITVSLESVQKHHAGNVTCTASNPAGIAMATASLTVVDAPYLRVYLQPVHHANVSTLVVDANRSYVAANGSTLVVDASANRSYVAANASTLVEVWAGRDVELSYLTEAYPPLAHHRWATPTEGNGSVSVYSKSDVLVSSLLLRRVHQDDQGTYTFFFSSPLLSGSQTIDLRVYRPPKAVIRLTGNRTVTCSSSGYPRPSVRWLTCPGLSHTCGDNATYQLSEADQSEEAEALQEEVQRELTLPSNSDDVTVDSAVLLLLLLAVLYKYKQKPRYEIRWKIIDGKSPYPNVVVDTNFYKMIKSGRHMSQPDFAPPEIYQLMIGCWNLEPTRRPTFIVIGQLIKNLLSANEAVTQQNVSCPDVTRQQSGAAAQTLKPDTEDDPQHDIMEEAEPLVRMKMTNNVYH